MLKKSMLWLKRSERRKRVTKKIDDVQSHTQNTTLGANSDAVSRLQSMLPEVAEHTALAARALTVTQIKSD